MPFSAYVLPSWYSVRREFGENGRKSRFGNSEVKFTKLSCLFVRNINRDAALDSIFIFLFPQGASKLIS